MNVHGFNKTEQKLAIQKCMNEIEAAGQIWLKKDQERREQIEAVHTARVLLSPGHRITDSRSFISSMSSDMAAYAGFRSNVGIC